MESSAKLIGQLADKRDVSACGSYEDRIAKHRCFKREGNKMFETPSNAMLRMLKAREAIVRKATFFSSIIFNAKLIESKKHKTMWTDGLNIHFNPDFVTHPKADPYIEATLLENVLHNALLHWPRKKWRDDKMWNEACDQSINQVIGSYFAAPPWIKNRPEFWALSPEEIYPLLEKEPQPPKPKPQQGQGQGDGNEENKDPNDPTGGEKPGQMQAAASPEEEEQGQRDWARALAGAVDRAKKAGTMPGQILRLVDQLMPKDRVDWKEILRDMSRDAKAKTTRTWSRPNRRRLGGGDYMPGYGNDAIFRLVICFDVSGSVDHKMHKAMREEVASLIQQNIINRCTMIAVDTQIHNEADISSVEELEAWNPEGGGGTDFKSAMKHVGEMEDVVGVLFLTDMETTSFGDPLDCPVVWVNWNDNEIVAPYGRTVSYK